MSAILFYRIRRRDRQKKDSAAFQTSGKLRNQLPFANYKSVTSPHTHARELLHHTPTRGNLVINLVVVHILAAHGGNHVVAFVGGVGLHGEGLARVGREVEVEVGAVVAVVDVLGAAVAVAAGHALVHQLPARRQVVRQSQLRHTVVARVLHRDLHIHVGTNGQIIHIQRIAVLVEVVHRHADEVAFFLHGVLGHRGLGEDVGNQFLATVVLDFHGVITQFRHEAEHRRTHVGVQRVVFAVGLHEGGEVLARNALLLSIFAQGEQGKSG